ncbi:MAG: hypothetical protein JXR97_01000 [Planctomycetes bacterium]|nr:hypothetical protein [Planctomycetota bacterium]
MAENSGMDSFKGVIFIFILFCISGFQSCQEIRYKTGGKTDETKIDKITENHDKYGRLVSYTVWYGFKNENSGKRVAGSIIVSDNDIGQYSRGQNITVEYIGGDIYDSRIVGTGTVFWVVLFCIMSVLFGCFTFMFIKHVNEKTGKKKR